MQRQRQNNLKDPREDAHPFGVQVVSKFKGEGKLDPADVISGLKHGSNGTNSHPDKSDIRNKWTAMWRSYGRDVSIAVLFMVSLTAICLATWNKVQTDVEVQKLQSENGDLKKAIQNLFLRAEKAENGSVTQKLNDDGGNVAVYNKTLLETLTAEIHSLKTKVEDADPRQTSTGSMILAPGEVRTLFRVPCSGTYFFHVVAIVQSGPGIRQINFEIYLGSFNYIVSSPNAGETVVRAYTKALTANDYVKIRSFGATTSYIADITINSHLLGICQ